MLDSEHSDTAKPKSRDAKNRIELKQTKERLERMQRREIERLAADKLSDPQDVWLAGVAVGDVCNEEGDVDPELVGKAIDALVEKHPHWQASRPETPRRGLTSGATSPAQRRAPSWADALRQPPGLESVNALRITDRSAHGVKQPRRASGSPPSGPAKPDHAS